MSILIAVRHARSTANTAGILAGRLPGTLLDETGEQQARALGERLRGVPLHTVVSSPLERCLQTTSLALATAGSELEPTTDDRLLESNYGQWQGRALSELAQDPLWQVVQERPEEARFPDGEAMVEVRERIVDCVLDWDQRLPADAVWLLASHGDPLAALLNWAVGADFRHVQRLGLDPASASVIALPGPEGKPPRVLALNSIGGSLRRWTTTSAPQVGGAADPGPAD